MHKCELYTMADELILQKNTPIEPDRKSIYFFAYLLMIGITLLSDSTVNAAKERQRKRVFVPVD